MSTPNAELVQKLREVCAHNNAEDAEDLTIEAATRIEQLETELSQSQAALLEAKEEMRERIKSKLFQLFLRQNFWHAHHVDLVWRMDGKDVTEEADWLKDVWYAIRALPLKESTEPQG